MKFSVQWWGYNRQYKAKEAKRLYGTNRLVERFFLKLKEHIIYGRVYETMQGLMVAVDMLVELYNRDWRIERLDFFSTEQVRRSILTSLARCA